MFSINSCYEKLLTREEVASLYMVNFVAEKFEEGDYLRWLVVYL